MRRNSHRHCERNEGPSDAAPGCFVASLLAMTIQFDRTPLQPQDREHRGDKPGMTDRAAERRQPFHSRRLAEEPVLN